MFQNYKAPVSKVRGDTRLKALRQQMNTHDFDIYLVPHRDEYNNEYLPDCAKRLEWLTGFSGSAGYAVITAKRAILFVDSRYTLQAADQIDAEHWTIEPLMAGSVSQWIKDKLKPGETLGFDPQTHSANDIKNQKEWCAQKGAKLLPSPKNLIDTIWSDRPAPPMGQVEIHDLSFAGEPTRDKLTALETTMRAHKAELCLITSPDSICWLFNIRGDDIAHCPLVLASAIIRLGHYPKLFIDEAKLTIKTRAYLTQVADLQPPSQLQASITALSQDASVMIDVNQTSYLLYHQVLQAGGTVVETADPIALPRAIKNETEIQGTRNAHLRDGAAITTYLAWLDAQAVGTLDEITAAQKLEQIRADMAGSMPLKEISFDTIAGSGPNGAIVHYRVNENSNRIMQEGELFLCDSGAQYQDGTTDITRTIAIGTAGQEEKQAFTLVLKGHIAISRARFPQDTRGVDLDVLARMALWQAGFDYGHGTGHGVGSYLSVHEGPQSISRRSMQTLKTGMILSNEPGYYRPNAFGIRIENLLLVTPLEDIEKGDQAMLGFESLTLAPIDKRLIDTALLNEEELNWLNDYHARVQTALMPLVDSQTKEWLHQATTPLFK